MSHQIIIAGIYVNVRTSISHEYMSSHNRKHIALIYSYIYIPNGQLLSNTVFELGLVNIPTF